MVSVFDYTDYRRFLLDAYHDRKRREPRFSYRRIAESAGFKSAGFFTQILTGQSNISPQIAQGLATTFDLSDAQTRYFLLMVSYNQAQTHRQKLAAFKKMLRYRKAGPSTVDPAHYEFYDKWYYSAIRALLSFHPFDGDFTRLGKKLVPAIPGSQARKAVAVLEKLRLIEVVPTGGYRVTQQILSTGLNTDAVVINNYIVGTLDIARESLYRFPKEQRTLSSVTMSLSAQGYATIKDRLDRVRREIMEIAAEDSATDRVYQLNLQMFPLSHPDGQEDRNAH